MVQSPVFAFAQYFSGSFTHREWETLVQRFTPEIRLSKTSPYIDRFDPSTVEWFVERSTLENAGITYANPPVSQLAALGNENSVLAPVDESVYFGDLSGAKIYAHIRRAHSLPSIGGPASVDIQYWFFYPYNGQLRSGLISGGSHEGDWEHITVRVSNWRDIQNSRIEGIFYAAHGAREGRWLFEQSSVPQTGYYSLVKGTHPVVYSAWHSHASYESPGTKTRSVPVPDHCTGGYNWMPQAEIVAIDEDVYSLADQRMPTAPWLAFRGIWGATKSRGLAGDASSPRGPMHQENRTWYRDWGIRNHRKIVPGQKWGNVNAMVSWRNQIYAFAQNLWVIDPQTQTFRNLPTGEDWSNVTAATSIGQYAYVTTRRNHFYQVDLASGRVQRIVPGQEWGNVKALVSWRNQIYAFAQNLWVIDPVANTARQVNTGEHWSNVTAATTIGQNAYVTTSQNNCYQIDLATNQVRRIVPGQQWGNVKAMVSHQTLVIALAQDFWIIDPSTRAQNVATGEDWSNVTAATRIGQQVYATTNRDNFFEIQL